MLPLRVRELGKSDETIDRSSSPAGLMNFKKLRYRFPAVLLIGSEKRGLSEQLLESAHFTVRIPMSGGCDSINAAVAAGVLLFEIANQRH